MKKKLPFATLTLIFFQILISTNLLGSGDSTITKTPKNGVGGESPMLRTRISRANCGGGHAMPNDGRKVLPGMPDVLIWRAQLMMDHLPTVA